MGIVVTDIDDKQQKEFLSLYGITYEEELALHGIDKENEK